MWGRIKLAIAEWLVPGSGENASLRAELVEWTQFGNTEQEGRLALETEKKVLLQQIDALKKNASDAETRFEFVQRMADRFYEDLAKSKAEFISYLTRSEITQLDPQNEQMILHPEDIMRRIAEEADSMFGE